MGSVTPTSTGPEPPYLLHPSIKDKLDPTYRAFYNKHIFNKQQVHLQPVAASRTSGILIPGGGEKLSVGKTRDFHVRRRETDGPDVPVRVFTPEGEKPEKGWPAMVYYHGGGWVLGNIETENVVCTNLCRRARCVVISVDYRYGRIHPLANIHASVLFGFGKNRERGCGVERSPDSLPKIPIQQPSTTPGKLSSGCSQQLQHCSP